MFHQIPESHMHRIRWLFAIGWIVLIASMFYDPISTILTDPSNLHSHFHLDSQACIQVQGECLPQTPYKLAPRIFWSAVVPAAIFIIFVFGHETWRRICPLSFFSQLARKLDRQRRQKVIDSGIVRYELIQISPDSWLGKYHLYLGGNAELVQNSTLTISCVGKGFITCCRLCQQVTKRTLD